MTIHDSVMQRGSDELYYRLMIVTWLICDVTAGSLSFSHPPTNFEILFNPLYNVTCILLCFGVAACLEGEDSPDIDLICSYYKYG